MPPIKPILAQNIPCRSLGRSDIEKAIVAAKPTWSNPAKKTVRTIKIIQCQSYALVKNMRRRWTYTPISSGRNKISGTVNRSLFMAKIWSVSTTMSSGWRARPLRFVDKSGSMYSWTIGLCFGSILSWIHQYNTLHKGGRRIARRQLLTDRFQYPVCN